jgi:hypothetical protein
MKDLRRAIAFFGMFLLGLFFGRYAFPYFSPPQQAEEHAPELFEIHHKKLLELDARVKALEANPTQ